MKNIVRRSVIQNDVQNAKREGMDIVPFQPANYAVVPRKTKKVTDPEAITVDHYPVNYIYEITEIVSNITVKKEEHREVDTSNGIKGISVMFEVDVVKGAVNFYDGRNRIQVEENVPLSKVITADTKVLEVRAFQINILELNQNYYVKHQETFLKIEGNIL